MIVYVYSVLLAILLFFELLILEYDFLAPSFLSTLGFFVSSLFLIFYSDKWKVEIEFKTIICILLALLLFFIVNAAIKCEGRRLFMRDASEIYLISKAKTVVILFIILVASVLYWHEICRIAAYRGTVNSIGEIISNYRTIVYFSDSNNRLHFVNQISAQLFKFVSGFGYVALYYFCNNLALGDSLKNNRYYIYIIVSYVLSSYLLTSRSHYINYLVAAVLFFVTSKGQQTIKFWSEDKKETKRITSYMIILFFVFYFFRNVFGRNNQNAFGEYIANYFCGPTIGLNNYLVEYPSSVSNNNETFPAIGRFLFKVGTIDRASKSQIDFFYITPRIKNNVYTAFRRWINDFGICGMYILQAIFSALFTCMYKKCREQKHEFETILLGYMYIAVWSQFFDDLFYKTFISVSMLIQVVVIYCCYFYVRRIRFVVSKR